MIDDKKLIAMYNSRVPQSQMCSEFGVSTTAIQKKLKKLGIAGTRSKNRYVFNREKLKKDSPDYWYIVGLFAADGYINVTKSAHVVTFCLMWDPGRDLLNKLKDYLEYTGEVKEYESSFSKGKKYVLSITDKEWADDLRTILGYEAQKTENIVFPKFPSSESASMFFRGFMDGDGSYGIYNGQPQVQCFIKNESFKNAFSDYIYSNVGVRFGESIRKEGGTHIRLTSKATIKPFLEYIYSFGSELFLEYKKNKSEEILNKIS